MKKFILYRLIAALIGGYFVFIECCLYSIATNPDNWLVRLEALPLEIILVFIIYKLRQKALKNNMLAGKCFVTKN